MTEVNEVDELFGEVEDTESLPPVVAPRLNKTELSVLNYCEQLFWETGLTPTYEKVSEDLGIEKDVVSRVFKNEKFKSQLMLRGVDMAPEVSKKILTPQQLLLANMLLNLHDKRTVREKLAEVQVSSQQYHAWMRQPQFVEFLRKRGEALFKGSDWEAFKGLSKAVSSGDVNALKLFFEMRGIYNPRLQIDVNIEAVLVRVVEIVSKHVPNQQVLEAIANELESVVPYNPVGGLELTQAVESGG
jgi:hypothetical protein